MTRKEIEEMRKAFEQHKVRREADTERQEELKKLFPNGVLQPGTKSSTPKEIPQVFIDLANFFETRIDEFPKEFIIDLKTFLDEYSKVTIPAQHIIKLQESIIQGLEVLAQKAKPFDRRGKNKKEPKEPAELSETAKNFFKRCRLKKIDLTQSIDGILIDCQLKGIKIGRSTIGKYRKDFPEKFRLR